MIFEQAAAQKRLWLSRDNTFDQIMGTIKFQHISRERFW
jgi:hypothetical protein